MAYTADVKLGSTFPSKTRYFSLASGTKIKENRHFLILWELVPWSLSTSETVTFWTLPGIEVRLKKSVHTLIPGIKKGVSRYNLFIFLKYGHFICRR
jgi:hypothetical protein